MSTFTLPFPPSVNNLFANGKRGRFPTKRYEAWQADAGAELKRQRPAKVAGPVVLFLLFGIPDKRKRDLDNLLKAPLDLLVKHGIILADDCSCLQEIKAKWDETNSVCGVRVTVESFNSQRAEAA